ncbi:PEP-CTERM sorting domain-containing protein [Roseateles sp.]|uniref:PEP-CTERM sorting domain-containing protein n=1 Tax=Roseateles sp. TaxID=1971397 RepID=UPI0039EAD6F1
MKRTLPLVALATLLSAGTHAIATPVTTSNLLVNGGFESVVLAGGTWVNVAAMPGWTWLGGPGSGFEIRNNVAGQAQEGSNFIELDTTGNTLIGQYLDNLAAGASYDLSFWYSPRVFQPASTNGIQVYWNGVQLGGTLTGDGGSDNDWTLHQYRLTAQAGRNLLSFAAVGSSDSLGGNLDNVSLTSHVPEPGTLALTLAALAGCLLLPASLRRRAEARRAQALAAALAAPVPAGCRGADRG